MNLQENISRIRLLMESDSRKIKSALFPIFKKIFNGYNTFVDEYDYVSWFKEDTEYSEENVLFHKNKWGKLWIEDCESYKRLLSYARLISISEDELKNYLIEYLNERYKDEFSKSNPIKKIGENYCEDL